MDSTDREIQEGTVAIRTNEDAGVCTIGLSGELDMSNAGAVELELTRATKSGSTELVLDMRELEFIDSTGIALLVDLLGQRNDGSPPIGFVPSRFPAVIRVLEITGLAERLPPAKPAR